MNAKAVGLASGENSHQYLLLLFGINTEGILLSCRTVKIVDNSKDFADTRNHWAKDAIDFVSARGLVNGISDTIYAPNNSTTRAQLWTILARQNDADLTGGSIWYEKAQNWAKDKGVSDGANPNAAINRAQMVTILWRAMGQPAAASGASFADVPADSYYAQAVAWAIENGITAGVGNGKFDPDAACTRGQIVTFLYRAAGSPSGYANSGYTDVPETSYCAAPVAWAVALRVTSGTSAITFSPDALCTRAQIVTFLYRANA